MVALTLLVLGFIGCYAVPALLPYDYNHLDYDALLQPPSLKHWFGTNALGQDLLARILRGMQKSMLIGVCVALISTSIAATVGSIAGYFGGWRDRALMWLVDLLLVVPSFLLIAIVTPRTKGSGNVLWLIALLAVFGWMISSRMVRGLTMSLREREFIRAARYMGVSSRRIIVQHVVPNVASILIIDATLNVGFAILAETGLSFLGFGIQPPDVSLGTLIAGARAMPPPACRRGSSALVGIPQCAVRGARPVRTGCSGASLRQRVLIAIALDHAIRRSCCCRRADDRAGRHGAGAGTRRAARRARTERRRDALRHARPGRAGLDGRPRCGHVRRPHRRTLAPPRTRMHRRCTPMQPACCARSRTGPPLAGAASDPRRNRLTMRLCSRRAASCSLRAVRW